MVLNLYGNPLSTCTRRVAVVLHEKQVPFVFHPIDMANKEHKSPEFLAKQPFGQVPYIGTSLIPKDLKANALYQQAASTEAFAFNDFAEKIAVETVFKPMWGQATDQATVDRLLTSLSAKLDVYDKILSKQKYLAGDEITLADLYHLPYADLLPRASANIIQERPNVARWYKDVWSRPSWQAVKDSVKSTA